jgi:hypothetical protein
MTFSMSQPLSLHTVHASTSKIVVRLSGPHAIFNVTGVGIRIVVLIIPMKPCMAWDHDPDLPKPIRCVQEVGIDPLKINGIVKLGMLTKVGKALQRVVPK